MSDAYDDDLAREQAILETIQRAESLPNLPAPGAGGRPHKADPIKMIAWRQAHRASIAETARRWNVSEATVKRLSRQYAEAAELERRRWECDRLDNDLAQHEYGLRAMFVARRNQVLTWTGFGWHGRREAARGTPQELATESEYAAALEAADQAFPEDWARCIGRVSG